MSEPEARVHLVDRDHERRTGQRVAYCHRRGLTTHNPAEASCGACMRSVSLLGRYFGQRRPTRRDIRDALLDWVDPVVPPSAERAAIISELIAYLQRERARDEGEQCA